VTESNSHSDIRTSSGSWHLLGRLVEGINRHFQIHPRIMFVSENFDIQSASAAARGNNGCCTRLIELLSSEEDRAANVGAFAIYLMDNDGDSETSMRFAFLDVISWRVVAVKRWHVTVDEEEVARSCRRDDGFDDVPTPFRKDNFGDLECSICGDPLFAKERDGSVVLLARQLKMSYRCGRHRPNPNRSSLSARHVRHLRSEALCGTQTNVVSTLPPQFNVELPPLTCSPSFLRKLPSATALRAPFRKVALMMKQSLLLRPRAAGVYPTP
jgi:hypothetical protein